MGRLTKRKFDGTGVSIEGATWEAFEKLARYEDAEEEGRWVALPPKTQDVDFMRIFELITADREGRAIMLPCKVGDTVYYIDGGKSYKAKVSSLRINESGVRVYCERNFMGYIGFEGIYGKTVFLTREEAEGEKTDG